MLTSIWNIEVHVDTLNNKRSSTSATETKI